VHYEDLAANPEAVIGELCRWLEVPFDGERTRGTRYDVNHGVAGNRPRWDALVVHLEETWRTTMPIFHQRLISLLTAPLVPLRGGRTRGEPAGRGETAAPNLRRRGQAPWMTSRNSR
jgi:hypothetical protein